LLDAIDARWVRGLEVGTAEIFSALILAAVAPRLGWSLDGSPVARETRGDVRTIIDDVLRPIAVRLRLSRRDQEHTRQTLMILQRMIPPKPLRRGARLALMRRPAFRDATAMLEALAPAIGGAFAEAADAWKASGASPDLAAAEPAPIAHDGEGRVPPADGARRRRRGRRGGRRRNKEGGEATAVVAPPPAAPARAANLPPVWDDNYFFAALPSVPKRHAESHDDDTDRYGADVVATAAVGLGAAESPTAHAAHANPSPRPRRRRRGGRGRRKPGSILPDGESSSPEGGE